MPAPHPPGRDHGPGLGPVSRCRSCGAPIQWAYTPAGARTPIDAPAPDAGETELRQWGRVRIDDAGARLDPVRPNVALVLGYAVTLGALELELGDPPATLVPHWATCPDAQGWKAPKLGEATR